jgi:hypothetical protein
MKNDASKEDSDRKILINKYCINLKRMKKLNIAFRVSGNITS